MIFDNGPKFKSLPMQLHSGPSCKDQVFELVSAGFKIAKGTKYPCEDAFFISPHGFGVSDGVSSWKKYGFSSAKFSEDLMTHSKTILESVFKTKEKDCLTN